MRYSDLPTKAKMVHNILSVYFDASEEDVREGMAWYNKAYELCETLAGDYNYSPGKVAGVMAIISPGMTWEENISAPERILNLHNNGIRWEAWAGFSTYPANLQKAQRVLDGDYSAVSGRKVTSFYGNICGAFDAVTVDRWALRIAVGNLHLSGSQIVPGGQKCYNAIADAYRAAADLAGINPCDMQAVTWVAYRRMHNGRVRDNVEKKGVAA